MVGGRVLTADATRGIGDRSALLTPLVQPTRARQQFLELLNAARSSRGEMTVARLEGQ